MSAADPAARTIPRVKICGHTTTGDVRASVAAGADAIGVIAAVPVETPREVSTERAAALLDAVPPLVAGVLVTMPETPDEAVDLVESVRPDALQVHGACSTADLSRIVEAVSVPVVRTVDADDVELARDADGIADAILVDSTDERGAGGTGRTHDWDRARDLVASLDSPVVLAGGLTPENVADAVRSVAPFGVDVASGVEREGGVKDHDAVRRFVMEARSAHGVIA